MNHDLSFDKISRKESIRDKIVLVLNMPKKILKLRKGISSMRSGLRYIKKYQEIMKHECEHANFTFVLFLK